MSTRQERKLAGSGGRLVAIGAPIVIIGIVLALLLDGTALGIGVAIAVLGAIPVVVGIVLLLSAGTERHARKDRPFA
jgi:fumarate reductase subunit D